ncbi:isoprenyl transferase [Taibaiella soli]|nr:isoprenyl transferase [Taibaiella soli]
MNQASIFVPSHTLYKKSVITDMEVLQAIDRNKLPKHIAVIMDGNGRWAKERGEDRVYGHHEGVLSVREMVNTCAELGIPYLTLYAFSTENWNRPKEEVNALMELLVNTIRKEVDELKQNNVRMHVIGDFESLPEICQKELNEAKEITAMNTGLNLILALSYSSQWEITEAARKIAMDAVAGKIKPEDINDGLFHQYLNTAAFPDPELMIRTSGEHRISNFLLYQLAYAELYFSPVHWPAFRKQHLYEALLNYQQRERRFGKTSEQIQTNTPQHV